MIMTVQIEKAHLLSEKLLRLYDARQTVRKTIYTTVYGDIFLESPLKEFLQRIEVKILSLELQVKTVVSLTSGYNKDLHREICYIDRQDIKAGEIDISIKMDGSAILDLVTGDIVTKSVGPEPTDIK